MAATALDIFDHWLEMDALVRLKCNWCTAQDNSIWNVTDDTYINGCMLTLDRDYMMGWLLEIVEHESGVVNYLVMVSTPYGRDVFWYDLKQVGTFFDRTVDQAEVTAWALSKMYGSMEALEDAWMKDKDRERRRSLD